MIIRHGARSFRHIIRACAAVALAYCAGAQADPTDLESSIVAPATTNAGSVVSISVGVMNYGTDSGPYTVSAEIPYGGLIVDAMLGPHAESLGISCEQPTASSIACSGPSIPPGDALAINLDVLTIANPGMLTPVDAMVTTTNEPNQSNNESHAVIELLSNNAGPDLSITKAVLGSTAVFGGQTFAYELLVANEPGGASEAQTITVVDYMPSEVNVVSASGSGWICSIDIRIVRCTRGGLNTGATAPKIIIQATAPVVQSATTISNTAIVYGSADRSTSNNHTTLVTPVVPATTNEPPEVTADQFFGILEGPAGRPVTPAPGRVDAWDPEGAPLTFEFVAPPKNFPFQIDPGTGAITSKASIDFEKTPAFMDIVVSVSDGQSTTFTTVDLLVTDVDESDVAFNLFDRVDPVRAGTGEIVYAVEVTNLSAFKRTAPTIVKFTELPAGANFVAFQPTTGFWSCNPESTPFSCATDSPISAGAKAAFDLSFSVPATPGKVTLQGFVAEAYDPVQGNDADAEETTISPNAPPEFVSNQTFTVVAGAPAGYTPRPLPGKVKVNDDGDQLTFSSKPQQQPPIAIEIDKNGRLHLTQAVPLTALGTSFPFAVFVTDGTTEVSGSVQITVIANNAPTIQPQHAFHVAEGLATNRNVLPPPGAITASDADAGDVLSFSLVNPPPTFPFSVHPSTGVVTTSAALDHEQTTQYIATVSVSDGISSATTQMTIAIDDVGDGGCQNHGGDSDNDGFCNEFDPDDDGDNTPDGSDVCPLDATNQCHDFQLTVDDVDPVQVNASTLRYTVTMRNTSTFARTTPHKTKVTAVPAGATLLSMTSNTGNWTCNTAQVPYQCSSAMALGTGASSSFDLLYKAPATPGPVSLTASVDEASDPNASNNSETELTTISSASNAAPVIAAGQIFTIRAGAPTGEALRPAPGRVNATDANNDALSFSFKPGYAPPAPIAIDAAGFLRANAAIPAIQAGTSFDADVEVHDGTVTTSGKVTINVVANTAPTIAAQAFNIDEGQATGRAALPAPGKVVAADDPADTLSYSFVGVAPAFPFAIASNGSITNNAALDHEALPDGTRYTAQVAVSDGIASSAALVTIDVNDLGDGGCDNWGGDTDSDGFCNHFDGDDDGDGTPDGDDACPLDATNQCQDFGVTVKDVVDPVPVNASTLRYTVTMQNASTFARTTPYKAKITAIPSGATLIGVTSIAGGWACNTAQVPYQCTASANLAAGASSSFDLSFKAPATSGSVSLTASVDEALDTKLGNNVATESTTIEDASANTAPVLQPGQSFTLRAGASTGEAARPGQGRVLASDAEGDTLTFAFKQPFSPPAPVAIDDAGFLRAGAAIPATQAGTSFDADVEVSDGKATAGGKVTIRIVANSAPVVDMQTFDIDEGPITGRAVSPAPGRVVAIDDPADVLTYAFVDGAPSFPFAINPLDGAVTSRAPLDYEAVPNGRQYFVEVAVTDGIATTNAMIKIDVNDLADQGCDNWGGDTDGDGYCDDFDVCPNDFTNQCEGGNELPVAVDDEFATEFDTQLVAPAPGVLANDQNPKAGGLKVTAHSAPSDPNAKVTIEQSGRLVFDPPPGKVPKTIVVTYDIENIEGQHATGNALLHVGDVIFKHGFGDNSCDCNAPQ